MNKSILCNSSVRHEQIEKVSYGGFYNDYVLIKSVKEKGWEEIKKENEKKDKTDKEEIERIEQSRTKRMIKELALCNDFQYFFTQTIKENRSDLDDIIKRVQKEFKAYKRKNKDFIYLIIFEKHLDGVNFHLHGLVGGLGLDVYTNKNGFLSLADFECLGFNSLKKLGDTLLDRQKVSSYILKYISKDISKSSKGSTYFRSNGLKTATRTIIDDLDFSKLELKFENDFVKIYEEKKVDSI